MADASKCASFVIDKQCSAISEPLKPLESLPLFFLCILPASYLILAGPQALQLSQRRQPLVLSRQTVVLPLLLEKQLS